MKAKTQVVNPQRGRIQRVSGGKTVASLRDEAQVVIPQDVLEEYRDSLDSAIVLLDTVSDKVRGKGSAGIDPSSVLDGAIAIVELIMADIGAWAESEHVKLKSPRRS